MLTSCSGDGPPKMTAGWLMLRSPRAMVRSGEVVGRFKSGVEPTSDALVTAIKAQLEKK